jgi:membrane protease YdiL (CAAX protease family)
MSYIEKHNRITTTRTHSPASTFPPIAWLNKHPLANYFILAYSVTWLALLGAIVLIQFDLVPAESPVVEWAIQLGVFGPAIAAVVIASLSGGKAEVIDLLKRIVRWRVGVQWYLFVLVAVPLILVLGASVVYGQALFGALLDQWPILITNFLPLVAVTVAVTGLGEEPGWRGFALPRIQTKYGPLLGILALGLLWQMWHLPGMLMQPGGPSTFGLWTLATIVNGFVLAWVFNSTGSILLVILLHATQNSSSRLVSNLVASVDPVAVSDAVSFSNQLYIVSAVSFGVLVLLIGILTGGRFGFSRDAEAVDGYEDEGRMGSGGGSIRP